MVFKYGINAWRSASSSACKFRVRPVRTFFSSVQVREDRPKPPFFSSRPGPLPLGDKEQQREMEELIRRVESELESSPVTLAEAARRDNEKINPEATPEDPLPSFENDINPETQEMGGPKGVGTFTWAETVISKDWGSSTLRKYISHQYRLNKVAVEKCLRTKKITVNGVRPSRAGEIVKPGDKILFRTMRAGIVKKKTTSFRSQVTAPEIIFKDADILAINKPSNLPVQGGDSRAMHLGAYFEEWRLEKDTHPRLVHRLDKNVTGVLLLARTRRAAVALSAGFNPESPKAEKVEKTYLAVVLGSPKLTHGILNRPIRYGIDGIPHLVGLSEAKHVGHKDSQTTYWVLESVGEYSLVALQPLSGRKHQLRIHLSKELGMPIVGDTLYQGDPHSTILLHCFCIKINYPMFETMPGHPEPCVAGMENLLPPLQDLIRANENQISIVAPLSQQFLQFLATNRFTSFSKPHQSTSNTEQCKGFHIYQPGKAPSFPL